MLDINLQFTLFIYSLLIGVYLAVSYDLVDLFILKYANRIWTSIIQVLFFIVQAIIVFRVFFHIHYGYIPFYSYILFLVGFFLYHRFSRHYQSDQLTRIEKGVLWIIRLLRRLFVYLVIDPILDVWRVLLWISEYFRTLFKKLTKKLERPIKHITKWLKFGKGRKKRRQHNNCKFRLPFKRTKENY